MTTTAMFPSEQFPAPPSVTVPMPEGWQPFQVPKAHLALAKVPHGGNEFQPNITLTSTRTAGMTLEEAAESAAQAMAASPEWEEAGREFREAFGGHESFRIEGAFVHPQAGTLYQAALITIVPRGPFFDLVQLVGSCSASQTHECVPDIREILKGAVIND